MSWQQISIFIFLVMLASFFVVCAVCVGACRSLRAGRSSKDLIYSWRRPIFLSLCTLLVTTGFFLWLVLWYDDIMPQDKDYPPKGVENVFAGMSDVVLWPFIVVEILLGHDPNSGVMMLGLLFATGISWGFLIEVIIRLAARIKPTRGPRPN